MIMPVFIPMSHDSEPEKITCPKCGHKFVEPDDSALPVSLVIFMLFAMALAVLGIAYMALSFIGVVDIMDNRSETFLGYYLLTGIVAVVMGFIVDVVREFIREDKA